MMVPIITLGLTAIFVGMVVAVVFLIIKNREQDQRIVRLEKALLERGEPGRKI